MKFRVLIQLTGWLLTASAQLGAAPAGNVQFTNPVRAGDYPDPSVIRVGDDYWATATSSEWAPHFPLLHSRDLVNWEVKGHVFATTPSWAKSNFWAPEIAEYRGRFFVYYTARRQDNRLAVAVASADRPEGPYTDHGDLVAQEAGSIDAVPFTDAKGVRWLLWKEDGNSRKLPTPIWIQRLRDDGLQLVGEKKEILRNDAPWEGAVAEGPFVLRHGEYYYLFYSGNACCGRGCNYALGVARAKDMLGPWEKCPANPLLAGNAAWRCPGHGSIVTDRAGRYWLLYHAYAAKGFVATGRQMLLDEVVFGADGWPSINGGKGASSGAAAPAGVRTQNDVTRFRADFDANGGLPPGWQWPLGTTLESRQVDGRLTLVARTGSAAAVQSILVPSFVIETAVDARRLEKGADAGLVVFGDRVNHLALLTDGREVRVWNQRRGERVMVAATPARPGEMIRLRIACIDGSRFRFAVQDASGGWRELAGETDGSFLPPWDRGLRAGLQVTGADAAAGSFDYFSSVPGDDSLFAR
ncbi:family 43 glycosylhydrolase [Horticoccus sp. 23ND18S-11]|uniref:family 43 glycosylhydrolase n=1 Tax=Horticoccus sp. 23ND18S-11 TaxID=3391832 RepID=UPI0039C9A5A9